MRQKVSPSFSFCFFFFNSVSLLFFFLIDGSVRLLFFISGIGWLPTTSSKSARWSSTFMKKCWVSWTRTRIHHWAEPVRPAVTTVGAVQLVRQLRLDPQPRPLVLPPHQVGRLAALLLAVHPLPRLAAIKVCQARRLPETTTLPTVKRQDPSRRIRLSSFATIRY